MATDYEGAELRDNGVTGEILVFGYTHPMDFSIFYQHNLSQTIVSYDYAKSLNSFGHPIHTHIAIDTGMHRLGETIQHIDRIISMFRMENLLIDGVFTHLSADDSISNDILSHLGRRLPRVVVES